MIEVLNHPVENSCLLDGNITKVSIKSDNGADHYFRAKIYVNGVLFDEQGWSRVDNFTAHKDLLYLYYAYFKPVFNPLFPDGLHQQTHLVNKVQIDIEEFDLNTGNTTNQLSLPVFFMLYNVKSEVFTDADKIALLGVGAAALQIDPKGKIVLPIYSNATTEALSVTTKLNDGTVLNTETTASFSGKKVYLYSFDLGSANIDYSYLYLTVNIVLGAETLVKTFKLTRNPDHVIKEIVYQNNFGFFIPAYFDGQLSESSSFKTKTYDQYDGTKKIYQIDENITYTVNTGSIENTETYLANDVANSLETYLHVNNEFVPINTSIKRNLVQKDRTHVYNNSLTFYKKAGIPLYNNSGTPVVLSPTIYATGGMDVAFDIVKSIFEAIYSDSDPLYAIEFLTQTDKNLLAVNTASDSFTAIVGVPYLWSDVVSFRYKNLPAEFGSPYTSIDFKLTNGTVDVLTATLVINITNP